ncbi:tetratricopeptide repeat protein, partial [candidate division KSB1 bacterium]|nr:tetratricopeptide repeat protein [candidate division KSB1 bacterium]
TEVAAPAALPPNGNPEDFFSEGYLAYIASDYKKAETLYEHYLQIKPKDATVWCTLGEVRIRAQKVEAAILAFQNALAIEEKGLYYKELGIALDLNQQPDEALSAIQKAIKTGKKDSTIYLIGGKSHLKLQRFQEAQEMFEEAIKLNPNNFMAHFQLARTLAHLKNFQEAITHLEIIKAIRVDTPLKQAADQLLAQITSRKTTP